MDCLCSTNNEGRFGSLFDLIAIYGARNSERTVQNALRWMWIISCYHYCLLLNLNTHVRYDMRMWIKLNHASDLLGFFWFCVVFKGDPFCCCCCCELSTKNMWLQFTFRNGLWFRFFLHLRKIMCVFPKNRSAFQMSQTRIA